MKISFILAGSVGALAVATSAAAVAAPTATHFKNCTAMHAKYPHGVGLKNARDHVSSGKPVTNFYRNNALYQANKGSDRDGDGVACEAH